MNQKLHLFGAGMAAHMHLGAGVVDHARAPLEQAVNGAVDPFFVARDGIGRQNHGVIGLDVELTIAPL